MVNHYRLALGAAGKLAGTQPVLRNLGHCYSGEHREIDVTRSLRKVQNYENNECMVGILLAGVFALAGCGKSQQQQQGPPPMEIRGVKIDVPKLQQAFANEKPELRSVAVDAGSDIRYGKTADALAKLQKLAADPSVTEPTKKVINDVIEQVKQLAAKAPAQ